MRFLANPGNREEFLDGAGEVRVLQLEALFAIAMLQLVHGEREASRKSLQKCVETQAYHSEQYWWARAFVESFQIGAP